jgi:hypothetical protein
VQIEVSQNHVGSSCQVLIAPPDKNRERIVSDQTIPAIIKHFDNPPVAKIAVPVTFNICVDYGKLPVLGY